MKKKGFTLIELLVVISIIALLLSILMPSLSRVKENAKRITCSTKIRSTVLAATLAAVDDEKDRLPQGGWNTEAPFNINDDNPLLMRAGEFARLVHYIADTPYREQYEFGNADHLASLKEVDKIIVKSNVADNFSCVNLQTLNYDFPAMGMFEINNFNNIPHPFITEYGTAGYCGWLGYNYLAGLDTEKWDWAAIEGVSRISGVKQKKWRSPMKSSDSGGLVVMTDRTRYYKTGGQLLLLHGSGGRVDMTLRGDDPKNNEAAKAFTNIGYLDGSVESKRLSDTDYRQVTMYNDRMSIGPDYAFF